MNAARRRRSPFTPVLIALGAVVVVGLALYIVMISALDPARLRDMLQDAVLRSTGRTLTVTGPVHLRFGLSPQFEVDDIALDNIPGAAHPQMLTAASVRANLALLPLLSGSAVISALTIDQPDIVLERAADGTPNWVFTPEHRTLYTGHSSGGGGGHHAEIQKIALTGGKVIWAPLQGPARTVAIDNLSLSEENTDAPMVLSLAGSYAGPDGPVPLTLSGNSGSFQRLEGGPVSALAGTWPLTLQLSLEGADLRLEGGINHPDQLRGYQFRITGHANDLSQLNGLLPKPWLPPLAGVNFTALLSDDTGGQLRTSQVSVHAETSDLGRIVPGLVVRNAVLSAPGPGQLAQLNVDGTYADQPLRLAAAVMQPDILAATAPVQLTLSAQAAGATLDAHGTLPPGLGQSGLDVLVDAKAPDLSTLSPLVGHTLPPAHDFSLSAEVQDAGIKLRGITVHNLVVGSSLGDAAGDLTVNWNPRESVVGQLTSQKLDLDSILAGTPGQMLPSVWPPPSSSAPPVQIAAPPSDAPAPQPAPATAAASGAPFALPLQFLRTHDATLTLSVGDLAAWGQHYHDLAAHLELADGRLALNPFRAQAPEGAIIGGASIDATSDQPPVAVTLRSPSIAARAVAALLGYPDGASGTMQVDAELSGVGPTFATFEAGLNGRLGLAMVNGQIQNALVQGLIGDALQTAGVPSLGDGASDVRCLALRMDFANGVGTVRALAADTSRLSLSGDGTVDLSGGTLDLHLRPQVRLGPTEVSSPVSLSGKFGDVKVTLDPVFGNGRVGIQIGGAPSGSGCADKLALARNGLGGPMPAAAPAADTGLPFKIKKPKDLLQGLFH
jgi:AsmA protein